ncbi:MAG TPA: phosphatidate cytidylyltransferase [Deltaproteobacteria bacterium]|nr:phosphatidate cytidylyltransferase [Deltaproteobacteria bacterium]
MLTRIATGLLLAATVILLILYLPPFPLKLAIAAIVALAAYECGRMILPPHPTTSLAWAVTLGTALSAAVMFTPHDFPSLALALPLSLMLVFLFYMFRRGPLEVVLSQIAMTFLTVVYTGLLLSFLGLIRDLPNGSAWLFLVLATTFAADTGAYIAGHLLGRHKLAPHISPGKTVEGLLGGILLSFIAALICKYIISQDILFNDCLWVGIGSGLIGPLGDLSESLLKRSVGVKDSGNLIPGHGGLLDRIDALLFTSPVVYYYAAYLR